MKSKFLLRLKSVLLLPVLFLLLMATSMVGTAQNVTVTTDKDDYWPGEWVIITGSGWIADDEIQLTLTHIEPNIPDHGHDTWTVNARPDGTISEEWFVEDQELGTTFLLTAQSLAFPLMKAEATFTDGANYNLAVGSQSPSSVVAGSNATYLITITNQKAQTGSANVTFSLSPTALSNATYSFSPTSLSIVGAKDASFTTTLTVVTTVSTPMSQQFDVYSHFNGSSAVEEKKLNVPLTVTACTPPATPTIAAGSATTLCSGGSVMLTSSATTGNQWYKDAVLIAGATNQTYTATTAGSYTVIVTVNCPSATSAATVVTINNITAGVIAKGAVQPGPGCGILDPGITAVTTAATGSATPTYIWQQSTNGGSNWTTIASETAAQINPASFSVTTSFKRIATSTLNSLACSTESNILEYVVNPLPVVNAITPGGTTNVCIGSTLQLSSTTVGGVWSTSNPLLATVSTTGLVTGVAAGNPIISYTVTDAVTSCYRTVNKTVNVLSQPAAPTAVNYNASYDGASHSGSATVGSNETVDWYESATGPTSASAPTGTNFGTYTAWAEARNTTTGCKSATRTLVTVQINKKDASVVVADKTKVYGSDDPELTGTLTGFMPADNVVATYSREAGETVTGGPYEITAVLTPTDVLSNYN
ncbi:MAG: MBG domain-containing protein, partial [Bacteroidota bacterium]|nr:MBG domain-containing protein [Bacteroidota bacterium]